MRLLLLAAVAAFALLTTAIPANAAYENLRAPTSRCGPQTDRAASVGRQERAMLCMIDYARHAAGVGPALRTNGRLMRSADRKAGDILRCRQFSHTACGRRFDFRVRAAGYAPAIALGENIARGSGSYGAVRQIMASWLNSTGHRNNILGRHYREQGVALRVGTMSGHSGAAVWVHELGARG